MELSGIPWFSVHGIILNDPGRSVWPFCTRLVLLLGALGTFHSKSTGLDVGISSHTSLAGTSSWLTSILGFLWPFQSLCAGIRHSWITLQVGAFGVACVSRLREVVPHRRLFQILVPEMQSGFGPISILGFFRRLLLILVPRHKCVWQEVFDF